MAAIKKPKKLKMPKKPKAGASNAVLEKYLEKRKEVEKKNASRLAEYEKAKTKRETLKKKIAAI